MNILARALYFKNNSILKIIIKKRKKKKRKRKKEKEKKPWPLHTDDSDSS